MNAKSTKPGAASAEQRPEDVLAAARRWWTTAIVDIHPGVIRMRGYAIEDLIGRVSYPQMVWLMLRGELPTREQARLLEAALVAAVDHGPHAPSIAAYSSMHCCPAPPWMSSSALIALAIAPLSGRPQVTAMREIAIDGACGPWSTAATSAASSRRACSRVGSSPRSISHTICG